MHRLLSGACPQFFPLGLGLRLKRPTKIKRRGAWSQRISALSVRFNSRPFSSVCVFPLPIQWLLLPLILFLFYILLPRRISFETGTASPTEETDRPTTFLPVPTCSFFPFIFFFRLNVSAPRGERKKREFNRAALLVSINQPKTKRHWTMRAGAN